MAYIVNNNTVTIIPDSNINDILTENPTINKFYFLEGNYYLNDILNIDRDNVQFIGTLKDTTKSHIIQNNSERDGLNVISDSFEMKYISIHVTYDNKICLTVADADDCCIRNCYFYGNKKSFTIYFAGPKNISEGQETLDAYDNDNLDKNNIFKNNVVYSHWSGDCVSISLQLNCIVTGNIIRGGKFAIYMCKKGDVLKNIIYDSIDSGIHISLPSEKLNIIDNRIYECATSGIKISNQAEHGNFIRKPSYIIVKNNVIYDNKVNAMELNDVDNCTIIKNKFIGSNNYGVYMLRSKNIKIYKNKIAYFTVAFWLENTSKCVLKQNLCMSVYPNEGDTAFKVVNNSINNKIGSNKIMGKLQFIPIDIANLEQNTVHDNLHEEYYTIREERNIMK